MSKPRSKPKVRKKNLTSRGICDASAMKVRFIGPLHRLDGVAVSIAGEASAIPSKSNAMMATIDKRRIMPLARNSGFAPTRDMLLQELERLHATMRKNPDHQAQLKALEVLYHNELVRQKIPSDTPPSFEDTKYDRLIILILLAKSCDLRDSHNLPKAACDWLQDVGLVKNDRHADAFAIPKSTLKNSRIIKTTTSIIVLRRLGKVEKKIEELFDAGIDFFL